MLDAQFDPTLPPTYHPERDPLWAAASGMEQNTRIPTTADATNDARSTDRPNILALRIIIILRPRSENNPRDFLS